MIQNNKTHLTLTARIKQVLDFYMCSQRRMAQEFGIDTSAFNRYIRDENEKMLWPILPDILSMYPRLSRQWLYFGEGPMNIGFGVPLDQDVPLDAVRQAVLAMANDAGGSDAKLLRFIAGLPASSDEGDAELRAENEKLKEENRRLVSKLLDLLDSKNDKN